MSVVSASVLPPHLGVELASSGYAEYAAEIHELHGLLRAHCARRVSLRASRRAVLGFAGAEGESLQPKCLSCTVELELSYMRLRQTRPRVVWEISPMHGFTTVMVRRSAQGVTRRAHLTLPCEHRVARS